MRHPTTEQRIARSHGRVAWSVLHPVFVLAALALVAAAVRWL
jgi:hypothetical protein